MSDSNQDESWSIARDTAKKMGYVPIAFAQAIRMLVTDHMKNNGELRSVTKYQISRLFRGASFKSTIYFASKELRQDYLAANSACSIGDIVNLYGPLDLAAFITCFFLNRQMKKIGGSTWPLIAPHFARESSVGALVGVAIPKIGHGPGLLIAALRNVSHGLLSIDKPDLYKSYRSKIDADHKIFDEKVETEIWKTTSSQVTSIILTSLGFMSEFGEMIGTAVRSNTPVNKITNEKLRDFRLAHIWQETFLLGQEQPSEKLNTEFFPKEIDRNQAKENIKKARDGGQAWLDRGKSDLNAEQTPHLFAKKKVDPNLEIPEELKDVFSIEELTKMNEDDFDALIDQIDAEQKANSKREDVISNKDLEELQKQMD
jgi:hypothetical protein